MTLLIRSGTLITASETFKADLLIEGEIIGAIAADIPEGDHEVIDAPGLFILPGGV